MFVHIQTHNHIEGKAITGSGSRVWTQFVSVLFCELVFASKHEHRRVSATMAVWPQCFVCWLGQSEFILPKNAISKMIFADFGAKFFWVKYVYVCLRKR